MHPRPSETNWTGWVVRGHRRGPCTHTRSTGHRFPWAQHPCRESQVRPSKRIWSLFWFENTAVPFQRQPTVRCRHPRRLIQNRREILWRIKRRKVRQIMRKKRGDSTQNAVILLWFFPPGNRTGHASVAMACRLWNVLPIRNHSFVPSLGAFDESGRCNIRPPLLLTMNRCRNPMTFDELIHYVETIIEVLQRSCIIAMQCPLSLSLFGRVETSRLLDSKIRD